MKFELCAGIVGFMILTFSVVATFNPSYGIRAANPVVISHHELQADSLIGQTSSNENWVFVCVQMYRAQTPRQARKKKKTQISDTKRRTNRFARDGGVAPFLPQYQISMRAKESRILKATTTTKSFTNLLVWSTEIMPVNYWQMYIFYWHELQRSSGRRSGSRPLAMT